MTHVLVAIGSMGDLRPQLALARALRAEGADVLLLGLEDYAPLAADSGVPFRDVGTRLMGPVTPPLLARAARGSQTIGALLVRRWLHDSAGAIARALARAVHPGDHLVTGILGLAACRLLARRRGCRLTELTLAPTLPTAFADSLVGAPRAGRSRINAAYSRAVRRGSVTMGLPIARALDRSGAGEHVGAAGRGEGGETGGIIVACSPRLVPRAPDWPTGTRCTGHLVLEMPEWRPPPSLLRFLDSGEPPVYVGFGSVPVRDPAGEVARWAEAARRAGTRALLYPAAGFTDWDRDYGEHVHLVRFTPHDWLLPRTAAAVHHGGAGTTHGALAAGVPQGVIPFSLDQPYFARRVAALGLGPGGLGPGRTDVEGPTRILTDLTRGERAEGYRRRAREAARAVERENGARTAARILLGS